MTDSGFSSAASNRCAPAIIRPAAYNSATPATSSCPTWSIESTSKEASISRHFLASKTPHFQSSQPIRPPRFFGSKGNGGYSPCLNSPKEMSPMSSLTFDFRDLNTSRDVADTPRKRLSMSSVSSLDSFQIRCHPSLSVESVASNSPLEDEGCYTNSPNPLDLNDVGWKCDHRVLRDKDGNVDSSTEAKSIYRLMKSIPISKTNRRCNSIGKENSPVFRDARLNFTKQQGSIDSPSPLRPMATINSPGLSLQHFPHRRRNSSFLISPRLASSPLTRSFSSSSSSAFSSVALLSSHQPTVSRISSEKQEELRKSAEEKLREAKSPTNTSLTPEKSLVPGSISSLSAQTSNTSRPASAAPFCHGKESSFCRNSSPITARGSKRGLDALNSSMVLDTKRHKRNSTSESICTRRKMAFSSKDRKVKSADVAGASSSPFSSLKSGFRPISAPALILSDDDLPLSHSRLCSSNDTDSDDEAMMSLEQSQRLIDERLVEEIVADNTRAKKESGGSDRTMTTSDGGFNAPPSGIDGLITAPLLASLSEDVANEIEDQLVERLPRPRELFRSPSAPPVVSSQKSLGIVRRTKQRGEEDTPHGRRRYSIFPTLHEIGGHESDEEPTCSLNRSRSVNELDIMKAVEHGCSDDNLIGDFSRVCSLETVCGKCQDLKYISAETLIDVMIGNLDIGTYLIVDCRYPYEYEGGHIKGATLIWEEEVLFEKFLKKRPALERDRAPLLVFYCEFSSERGPRMARALRSRDRCLNMKCYPQLHYPEIYILKNGYKNFYNTTGTEVHCEPRSYRPMSDPGFSRELRICRTRSKAWALENKSGKLSKLKRF